MNTENLIIRAAQFISCLASTDETRAMLLAEGCSEEQAFLVFSAARCYLGEAPASYRGACDACRSALAADDVDQILCKGCRRGRKT